MQIAAKLQEGRDTPADTVIAVFGGMQRIADILGINRSSVWRWQTKRALPQLDGRVPAQYHVELLAAAKERGIHLTCTDLVLGRKAKK